MKNRRNIVEQKYPPLNPNDIWLKDGKFYRSTSEGWVVIDSKTEYTSKESMIADNPKGGTIGIDKETGEASIYNDVTKEWNPLGGGGGMTETTWQELKDKRDAGKLIPGSLYRITDYQCTTTQENTQSAGHQFDIVLLALSENKLAEEGWAMEHPTDIYDVTFADGVTKKCYIYESPNLEGCYNIVDVETLIGAVVLGSNLTINEENKTAVYEGDTYEDAMVEEGVPYNYFQNSNLSAWKVWYCLDNDKDRFAWADNTYKLNPPSIICDCYEGLNVKVDGPIDYSEKQFVNGTIYYRDEENDTIIPHMGNVPAYAWTSENNITIFTLSIAPNSFSGTYTYNTKGLISNISGNTGIIYKTTSYVEGLPNYDFPNGRGVIYRLIDEWNNDVGYDFKNIQLYFPIVDDEYVSDGEKTWVYTFCLYNSDEGIYEDGSLKRIEVSVDNTYAVFSNNIMVPDLPVNRYFRIPFNLLLGYYSIEDEDAYSSTECNFFNCNYAIVQHASNVYLYNCKMRDYVVEVSGIYYNTKKVLTES